jgi:hypothetical protein
MMMMPIHRPNAALISDLHLKQTTNLITPVGMSFSKLTMPRFEDGNLVIVK